MAMHNAFVGAKLLPSIGNEGYAANQSVGWDALRTASMAEANAAGHTRFEPATRPENKRGGSCGERRSDHAVTTAYSCSCG
jgi:hypothetical protein